MPSGGHNRKPKELKILQGTFRNGRNPKNEPDPDKIDMMPKPPSYLNKWAKRAWKELSKKLIDLGVLTIADLTVFEMMCFQYGLYRELDDRIRMYVTDRSTGKRRRRTYSEYFAGQNSQTIPEYTALKNSVNTFNTLAQKFGLNPVDRNRIDLPAPEEGVDPVEAMWNEG